MSKEITIKAKDLKPGSFFKWTPRQINWRYLTRSIMLTKENSIDLHHGKLLFIHSGCRQLILDPESEIIIRSEENGQ